MAAKKKAATKSVNSSYDAMHRSLRSLTPNDLLDAMQHEVERDEPRHDMLKRLAGRYNKVNGRRVMSAVMGLLTAKGKRDVRAVLLSDR